MASVDVSALLGFVYDAPLADDGWGRALAQLAAAFRATAAWLLHQDMDTLEAVATIYDDPLTSSGQVRHNAGVDVVSNAVKSMEPGHVLTDGDATAEAGFARGGIDREPAPAAGPRPMLGCKLASADPRVVRVLAVERAPGAGFEDDDRRLWTALVPHLQRATAIETELATVARRCFIGALQHLNDAAVLLGADATLELANRRAEQALAEGDAFTVVDGRLAAVRASEDQALRDLVREAAGPAGTSGTLCVRRNGRLPLHVRVVPLAAATSDKQHLRSRGAVVFAADPERASAPPLEQLQRQFGFTRMESHVATELLRGDGLKSVAERLGISRPTAGTHLAKLLEKTRTHRQAQLVGVLLRACHAVDGHGHETLAPNG